MIDESLAPPDYGDPTGETAIRNILTGADWSPRADWKILGPHRSDGSRPSILLAPDLALELMKFLAGTAETKETRSGQQIRARLKRNAPGAAPTATRSQSRQ